MITRPTAPRGVSRIVHATGRGRHKLIGRTMVVGLVSMASILCFSTAALGISVTIDSPAPVSEGNPPDMPVINFTVTLDAPAVGGETFDYATADGTATMGLDFLVAVAKVTLDPGQLTVNIPITIRGDSVAEGDETFTVTLSNLTGLTEGVSLIGTGTIADDLDKRRLSVDDVQMAEGDSGVTFFVFTLTLNESDPAVFAIGDETIDVTTADDTATVAGSDYLLLSPTTISFAAGEKSKDVPVVVIGDTNVEFNENFWFLLSNPVNLALPTQTVALGTIVTDEVWGPSAVPNGDTLNVIATVNDDTITAVIVTHFDTGEIAEAQEAIPEVPDDPDTVENEHVDAVPAVPALPAADIDIVQVNINGTLYPDLSLLTLTAPNPTLADVTAYQAALDAIKKETIKIVSISALSGDDVVDATLCDVALAIKTRQFGGNGNDILLAGANGDYLDGGLGNDHLIGGAGDEQAPEGFPNPYITGGPGDDIVEGGLGNDIISGGSGRNQVIGGGGDDAIWSEAGAYDVLDYMGSPGAVTVDLAAGTATDDGFGDTDTLHGAIAVLRGSTGDDTLTGYNNTGSTILGGPGNDTISGGRSGSIDILYGESGNDIIYGDGAAATSGGGDIIIGGSGNDLIFGGPGMDEIYGDGDFVPQNFDEPLTGIDYFEDDQMIQLTLHPLGQGALPITAPYAIIAPGGILNITTCLLGAGDATVGGSFRLPASELYNPAGPTLAAPGVAPSSDTGYDLADVTSGGGLFGGGGMDRIAGGGGSDTIYGGSDTYGTDWPEGPVANNRDSNDIIFGDYVVDRASCSYGNWGPYKPLAADLDPVTRPGGADTIHAGFGDDIVMGGPGADFICGNVGFDTIYGDFFFEATDDIEYNAIAATLGSEGWADVIRGNEGLDYLFGGPGDDWLIGGDPNDGEGGDASDGIERPAEYIDEYPGDVMQGNSGNDVFIGCDLYDLPLRTQVNENNPDYIDRTPMRRTGFPGTDSGPQDTIDYSMVPTVANGGEGIVVDLGNDVPGMGSASNDGEGGQDTIYAIENVVGSRNDDTIKGNRKSDESLYTGRYYNRVVDDAFGVRWFPRYAGHTARYTVGRLQPGQTSGGEQGWDNILVGGDGNDTIIGRDGCDALAGGNGDDILWGDGNNTAGGLPPPGSDDPARSGSDEIWGDDGDDQIFGEWGNDVVHGGAGNNYLDGGNGTDALYYGESGSVVINLSEANVNLTDWSTLATTYAAYGWPLDPLAVIVPPGGFPVVAAMNVPDDTSSPWGTTTIAFPGGNVLPGFDYNPADLASHRGLGTVFHHGTNYDVVVNRNPATPPTAIGAVSSYDRFEVVIGSSAADVIYGHGSTSTTIYGQSGSDILVGGTNDDSLHGEGGNDILDGGLGDDQIVGGTPPATPPGPQLETGSDWISFYHSAAGVVVNLGESGPQDTSGAGNDNIVEIQNVLGSKFNDVFTGNSRQNVLLGDDGDDILAGRADNDIFQSNRYYVVSDTLDGGAGSDTADYRFGDPNLISIGACPAPNAADTCANNDGEDGTDRLFNIEVYNQPVANLQLSLLPGPNKRTITPGQSVKLEFSVTGGDGNYKAVFDPITAGEGSDEEAILAAPDDQGAPVSPFTIDTVLPKHKAVQQLTGTAVAGTWKFVVYARPLATTSFRITVNDMATTVPGQDAPPPKQIAISVEVVVASELSVSIQQSEYTIKAGESVQLQGVATGGTPPYTVLWTLADGSPATGLSATNVLLPTANPTATTSYKMTVTDSTPDSSSQVMTATTKVTVTPASAAVPPSGASTPNGSNPSGSTPGSSNGANADSTAAAAQTPAEVSGNQESAPVVAAPMCGFGVTSWVMVGNLLAMAVMKRRRW